MVLERLVGQFNDKHQCDSGSADSRSKTCPPANVIGFDNAIQIIQTGGLRIAIWGDNRAVPDPSLDHYLTNIDVLILPVKTVLSRAEVDAIVRKYDPKAIIPAHYFLNGLTTDVSDLESAGGWVSDQEKVHPADVRRLDSAELTLNTAALKGTHPRIYYCATKDPCVSWGWSMLALESPPQGLNEYSRFALCPHSSSVFLLLRFLVNTA